ncbi:MAG: hypothetical protein Q8L86_07810 [Vicinamibacterales bacterium]|nr:hypothetical protein [Vicinamibacterales bacterium]
MALTAFQQYVCRLLADRRRAQGESYVADGVALSIALDTQRLSRDLDLFHDTEEAVARSWDRDRAALEAEDCVVTPVRERPGFVEAQVARGADTLVIEWARDSAFRFFPLVEHDMLGLTLHPFGLATNKVLALIGRLEVRDWIDVIECDARLQPLGLLAWAACGKDPGFTPPGLLAQARRSSHYSEAEVATLAFEGPAPRAAELSRQWHAALEGADAIVASLPAVHVGEAVMTADARLFRGSADQLQRALADDGVRFHAGRLGGALPQVKA